MFGREFMIRTDNRTLKKTPYILNSVSMDITPNPLFSTMVDCLMPSIMVSIAEMLAFESSRLAF